jgi:HNH endonuclease
LHKDSRPQDGSAGRLLPGKGRRELATRKSISASTRWNVFYRDGFACRYWGVQAGEEGVELVIDHVLSVADGGDDRIDNLATACKQCNGGKGAKSLSDIPTPEEVVARVRLRASNLSALRVGIAETIQAQKDLEQEIVNIKCAAYEVKSVVMKPGEKKLAVKLLQEFNAEYLVEWYGSAAQNHVCEDRAIMYICGCARKVRSS